MDQNIVKELQTIMYEYGILFNGFPLKMDPGAVFNFDFQNYISIVNTRMVPKIAKRLKEHPEENVEIYSQYVLAKYRDLVTKEVVKLMSGGDSFLEKEMKQVIQLHEQEVLRYNLGNLSEKQWYLENFLNTHLEKYREIAQTSPMLCLENIAILRVPELQKRLIQDKEVKRWLKGFILCALIKENWDKWLPKLFTYPRTANLEEYMNKWIAKDKIHVKCAKEIFGDYYQQIKIWLKGYEKKVEAKK